MSVALEALIAAAHADLGYMALLVLAPGDLDLGVDEGSCSLLQDGVLCVITAVDLEAGVLEIAP